LEDSTPFKKGKTMKWKLERIVTVAAVLAIVAGADVTKAELVAYWDFDNQSGNTVVDSVAGRSGRFFGNPVVVDGHFGGALEFDGVNDYIDCGGGKQTGDPNTWADIGSAITVAAWIKVDRFTRQYQALITKGDGTWRLSRDGTQNGILFGGQQAQHNVENSRNRKRERRPMAPCRGNLRRVSGVPVRRRQAGWFTPGGL